MFTALLDRVPCTVQLVALDGMRPPSTGDGEHFYDVSIEAAVQTDFPRLFFLNMKAGLKSVGEEAFEFSATYVLTAMTAESSGLDAIAEQAAKEVAWPMFHSLYCLSATQCGIEPFSSLETGPTVRWVQPEGLPAGPLPGMH